MNDSEGPTCLLFFLAYSDHSGSSYRFWKASHDEPAQFVFDPVTPERSSSGTYSGGRPNQGKLDSAQAEALLERVRNLEADTECHIDKRMMGTGSFRIREGDGPERHFMIRSSSSREAFDTFLEPYREP